MPPLVTVSAALLSTNTQSERERNFLNTCSAKTPAAAGVSFPHWVFILMKSRESGSWEVTP